MTKYALSLSLLVLTGLVGGCDNDPGEGEVAAKVAPAQAEPASDTPTADTPAATGAVVYTLSPADSAVKFVGAKVTAKHNGEFKAFDGTITVVDNDPTKSQVVVEIETASVLADEEKLTNHLKSPDFFDAEKFPKATFKSTAIAPIEGEKPAEAPDATHTITGNLQLHGVTKSVSFPAKVAVADGKAMADASFVINRKDFEITYPGMPDNLIKDDVLIELHVVGTPKS